MMGRLDEEDYGEAGCDEAGCDEAGCDETGCDEAGNEGTMTQQAKPARSGNCLLASVAG